MSISRAKLRNCFDKLPNIFYMNVPGNIWTYIVLFKKYTQNLCVYKWAYIFIILLKKLTMTKRVYILLQIISMAFCVRHCMLMIRKKDVTNSNCAFIMKGKHCKMVRVRNCELETQCGFCNCGNCLSSLWTTKSLWQQTVSKRERH